MKIAGICSKHGYYKGEKCPKCKEKKITTGGISNGCTSK